MSLQVVCPDCGAQMTAPDSLAGSCRHHGGCLREKGRLDEAIASYKKAIELDSALAVAHTNLGIALRCKALLKKAEEQPS